jgi:hypothetical protein
LPIITVENDGYLGLRIAVKTTAAFVMVAVTFRRDASQGKRAAIFTAIFSQDSSGTILQRE